MPSMRATSPHDAEAPDWAAIAGELIQARQTVLPKRLVAPGPDAAQQQTILAAAAAAPDHRQLLPWRFNAVPPARRGALAEAFAQALLERDPAAAPEQVAQAGDKAHRAPWLMLVVVDGLCGDPRVDLHERILSAGCAVQNVLLMATALGFGSALTSGQALGSDSLRRLFALREGQHALCFISIGTALSHGGSRVRPAVADFFRMLGDDSPDA